jgi:hypothetical protein
LLRSTDRSGSSSGFVNWYVLLRGVGSALAADNWCAIVKWGEDEA